jgi:hypothetical protein
VTQPTLHTERLRLVPVADEHLQFENELDSDPEVMGYITGRALSTEEVEQAHRRRLAAAVEVPGLGFSAGFADDEFVGWWILQPPNGPDQPRIAGEADLGLPSATPALAPRIRQRGSARVDPLRVRRYWPRSDLRPDDGSQRRITGHHERARSG